MQRQKEAVAKNLDEANAAKAEAAMIKAEADAEKAKALAEAAKAEALAKVKAKAEEKEKEVAPSGKVLFFIAALVFIVLVILHFLIRSYRETVRTRTKHETEMSPNDHGLVTTPLQEIVTHDNQLATVAIDSLTLTTW